MAAHGFRFLADRMWDHELGGWYRLLDRAGTPLEGATKHAHGASYAISACVASYELTADPECLDLAQRAFRWLEEHLHDPAGGGYFVFCRRDGRPILAPHAPPAPPGASRDAIGTPIGFKDANTTADLLRSFSDLHRVWPDPLVRERALELLGIVRDRLVVAPGVMHQYAHPDWTPLPDFVRYGQILRAANHLVAASQAFGSCARAKTLEVARSMVDAMLSVAWDEGRGGFHLAGGSFGPTRIEDTVLFLREKRWWPQAEGMRALLAMARLHPAAAAGYRAHFVRLWEYVKTYLVDTRRGGWFAAGLDTSPAAKSGPKATMWKDCSHEVEALLDALAMPGAT
jgi:mannobiose 2-epimerase